MDFGLPFCPIFVRDFGRAKKRGYVVIGCTQLHSLGDPDGYRHVYEA